MERERMFGILLGPHWDNRATSAERTARVVLEKELAELDEYRATCAEFGGEDTRASWLQTRLSGLIEALRRYRRDFGPCPKE